MSVLKEKSFIGIYSILTFLFLTFQFQQNTIVCFPDSNSVISSTFIIIGIGFFYGKILEKLSYHYKKGFLILAGFLSAFFSFVSVMGKFYSASVEIGLQAMLHQKNGEWMKLASSFVGGCILFFFIILAMSILKQEESNEDSVLIKVQSFLFDSHCFWKQCLLIGICWLPQIIIRYPGAIGRDGWVALSQYYGQMEYTTQHPIVFTLLLGKFTDLGLAMGNGNYGFFCLILLQVLATIFVVAYSIRTLRHFKAPYWCCSFGLFMAMVMPSMVAYATTAIIDAFFCAAFMLLVVELVYYLFDSEIYKKSWKHLFLTAVAVFGTFVRYNGIYIVAIVWVCVLIRELYLLRKKEQRTRFTILILLVLFVPMAVGKTGVRMLNEKYEAQAVSKRARFVVPIQQIANYMTYYGDDVTKEEMESIQKVMDLTVKQYKKKYNPLTFDSIKRAFQNDASKEKIREFLKIWVRLFFRHPGSYVNATLNQNYFLFSPLADNCRYYGDVYTNASGKHYDLSHLYTVKEEAKERQRTLRNYYYRFTQFPVVGLLVNQGVYSFCLIGICLYALYEKKGKLLFLSIPLILILLIALVAPAAFGNARYTYPMVYAMPLFIGMFYRKDGSREEIEK